MGFKVTRTDYVGGYNILASENFQFIEGGATLDAASFGAGVVDAGTLLARKKADGLFVEFVGLDVDNYDDFGVLNVDVTMSADENEIVGEVITRGSVYEDKLPENADIEAFKDAAPMIRFVSHVK